jgi:hypothetical protein
LCQMIVERGACMEMVYRERWEAEIAEMRRVLAGLAMKEECKWGKPTYTVDGKNIVIMQGFKEYFGLGFFQGALLTDPKKVLVQLGQVHAGRVMKFTSAKDITAKAATIKGYVREAIAVECQGALQVRNRNRAQADFGALRAHHWCHAIGRVAVRIACNRCPTGVVAVKPRAGVHIEFGPLPRPQRDAALRAH